MPAVIEAITKSIDAVWIPMNHCDTAGVRQEQLLYTAGVKKKYKLVRQALRPVKSHSSLKPITVTVRCYESDVLVCPHVLGSRTLPCFRNFWASSADCLRQMMKGWRKERKRARKEDGK